MVLGILGRWTKKAFDWCVALAASVKQVETRSKELIPNGGSSMRDEVAAMRAVLLEQSAVLSEQSATLAQQNVVIAELQQRRKLLRR